MRNISANGLAKLANRYGNEPICIVEIDWYVDANGAAATRPMPTGTSPARRPSPARSLTGNLDDVVDIVLGNGVRTDRTYAGRHGRLDQERL